MTRLRTLSQLRQDYGLTPFHVPENNRNGLEKSSCEPVEQEENHEKGPRGSWAGNHMGNPSQYE